MAATRRPHPDEADRPADDAESRIDPDDLPGADTQAGSVFDPVAGEDIADPADDPVSDDEWRDRGGIDDVSAPPQPLDFDDGDESRPNGPQPTRDGGTWDDEGADSGRLKPPSELHSDGKTRRGSR